MLSTKSKHNQDIGEYCKKQKFYDIAISRFYYSLYQLILEYLEKEGISKEVIQESSTDPNANSHQKTIDYFILYIVENLSKSKIPFSVITDFSLIHNCRKARHSADYKRNLISEKEFLKFYREYDTIKTNFEKHKQLWEGSS